MIKRKKARENYAILWKKKIVRYFSTFKALSTSFYAEFLVIINVERDKDKL